MKEVFNTDLLTHMILFYLLIEIRACQQVSRNMKGRFRMPGEKF